MDSPRKSVLCILLTAILSSLAFATADKSGGDGWTGWKCDDLTPDLCPLNAEKGYVTMRGGIKVPYWKYTAVSAPSNASLLPIITIHGGPGWTHNYMLPLKQQACRGREVVFYDQAGGGDSILPKPNATVKDEYPWLLDTSYYATEELPKMIQFLGYKKYHLLASSWGTMLSQVFALNTSLSSPGLVSMVLSGPLSDAQLYVQSQWQEDGGGVGSLPPYIQKRIQALQEEHKFDSLEYQAIDAALTGFFTCRTTPQPDCFLDAVEKMNMEIYVGMQGPSEFAISGTIAHFNMTGRLHELKRIPVLLSSGQYDTMRPATVDALYQQLELSERLLLEKSGHTSMIDEPGPMNDAIASFFDRVEESLSNPPFVPKAPYTSSTLNGTDVEVDVATGSTSYLAFVLAGCGTALGVAVGWMIGVRSAQQQQRQKYLSIL